MCYPTPTKNVRDTIFSRTEARGQGHKDGETVCINTPNLVYSYTSNDMDAIFQELRLEVKVTGTQKQYVTLHDPKMYPQTKLGIPSSNNIRDMLQLQYSRTEARGHGHSDLKARTDFNNV